MARVPVSEPATGVATVAAMAHLLHLDSGADAEHSLSRSLTATFAQAWPGSRTYRDLHGHPLPHLEHSALHWLPADRPAGLVPPGAAELEQELLDEVTLADVLLIGAPLYNYSMPSTLKAWIDRIHLPGVTTGAATMPHAGKHAVLVSPRGLAYEPGDPLAGRDHAVPPLQLVLGDALGMHVHVVTVSYTLADAMPDLEVHADRFHRELARAHEDLARLAAELAA